MSYFRTFHAPSHKQTKRSADDETKAVITMRLRKISTNETIGHEMNRELILAMRRLCAYNIHTHSQLYNFLITHPKEDRICDELWRASQVVFQNMDGDDWFIEDCSALLYAREKDYAQDYRVLEHGPAPYVPERTEMPNKYQRVMRM